MERLPDQNADENVVTFDLIDIFNESKTEMNQIDSKEIPDDILKDILDNPEVFQCKQFDASNEQDQTPRSRTANRFKNITKDYVDEIASKSCKKKTHKQTAWGVKVFRGKEICI